MESSGQPIPVELFASFNEALVATNGRLWSRYQHSWEPHLYRVKYSFDDMDDYVRFIERWHNISSKPVKEVMRNSKWRSIMRRCGLSIFERMIPTTH